MGLHRLLQRGFAMLYQYKLQDATSKADLAQSLRVDDSLIQYSECALLAENSKDLHYKMKGARYLVKRFCFNLKSLWFTVYPIVFSGVCCGFESNRLRLSQTNGKIQKHKFNPEIQFSRIGKSLGISL